MNKIEQGAPGMGMDPMWWYDVDGSRRGPVSDEELRDRLLQGELTARTLVWREGQAQWQPIGEIDELQPLLRALPPELPARAQDAAPDWPAASAGRRFFARLIDLWIFAIVIGLVAGLVLPRLAPGAYFHLMKPDAPAALLGMLMLPLAMVIEAAVFAVFRTTPGKALLQVRVTDLAGRPPTRAGYAFRLIAVYWLGFGAGVPIVSLITMFMQRSAVRKDGVAAYDVGRFRVKAPPRLGFGRIGLAVLAVASVVAVNGWSTKQDRDARQKSAAGFAWTNPHTGSAVDVPPGWLVERQHNDTGDEVHVFISSATGTKLVFAWEEMTSEMSIDHYCNAWTRAVRGKMVVALDRGEDDVREGSGHLESNEAVRLHATIRKGSDRTFWRVVVLGMPGAEPLTAETDELKRRLLGTVGAPDRDRSI